MTVLIVFGGSAAARVPVRAAAEFLPGGEAVVLSLSTRHLCGSRVPASQVDKVLAVGKFNDLAAGGEISLPDAAASPQFPQPA